MKWRLQDLELAFTTCRRDPAYLPVTLASALLADRAIHELKRLTVFVDAPDLGCIGPLSQHRKIRWVAQDDEESARAAAYQLHQRASFNYWRALRGLEPGSRGLIVCEDDVVFREGWLGLLLQSLEEMQERKLNEFVLALYSTHEHENPPLRRGTFYSSYFAASFFGTQGMFFPASQVAPVREAIGQHSVAARRLPYDLAICEYSTRQQNLYTTRHSLVQHIGQRTTGLGGMHRSPSFERPWPAAPPR